MALTPLELARIGVLLTTRSAEGQIIAELRRRFPLLPLTRCDRSDLGAAAPFRAYGRFDLYLVSDGDDCWQVTSDPQHATGLVVVKNNENA